MENHLLWLVKSNISMAIFTTERRRLRNIVSVALVAVVAIAGLATGMARMALSGLEKK